MWGSTCVILRVGESQQTTQNQEPLPASAQIAFVKSSPTVPVPELKHLIEEKEGKIEKSYSQTPTIKEKDITSTLKKVENEPTEDGREGDHADTKGHCRCQKGQRPSRSNDSQSFDVIPGDFAMDMLNKFEKKALSNEDNLVDSYVSRPFNSNEFQQVYATGVVYLPLGNDNSISAEIEDPSSTRHSSGCDDSGVFLEDLPYTPENTTTNATTIVSAETGDNHIEKTGERKQLSPEMRQYSIDAQGLDSDAEKSDDLGLASSSVDSADDLDGDPLPSRLKIEPPSQLLKKPPPVPPRRSIGNGHYVSQKELVLTTNGIEPDLNPTTPLVYNVNTIENLPSEVFTDASKKQPGGFKWKSEECLRLPTEAKWLQKQDMKAVSVKDRIAMFSEMETTSVVNKTDPSLHRYSSENSVNSVPPEEIPETKCQVVSIKSTASEDFPSLSRDTKWYSMYSLPLTSSTSQHESKPDAGEVKITSNTSSLVTAPLPQESANRAPLIEVSNGVSNLKVDTENFQRSEKPIISSYPKTQLANNKRYNNNYGRYSLNPIRTTDDLLSKKNVGLLSIIDSRKQPVVKLKGLVIPDKPQQSPTSKALPTIVSNDSVILNSKTDVDIEKDIKRSMLSAASYKTMSLPRTRSEIKAKLEPVNYDISKLMSETPWKGYVNENKSTILPKYSPAFKSRTTLDLPNAVTSSLSPTPPSSITSPLSPPPSSPSSICSSNASSATSVATMQQNIFQFSLSHSKPVTPVLPEKPIMSPPSLPSDIEYEGDNSEDSSASASPMITKLISPSPSSRQLGASLSTTRYESPAESSRNAHLYSNSHSMNDKNQIWKTSKTALDAKSNDAYVPEKLNNSDRQARQQFLSSVNKISSLDYKSIDRYNDCRLENGKSDYFETQKYNSLPTSSVPADAPDSHTGRKHIFSATSQEVQAVKYRAQPLSLNQVLKNGVCESEAVNVSKEYNIKTLSNEDSCKTTDVRNSCDMGNGKSCKDASKMSTSDYGYDKSPWSRSADLIQFKKSKLDSEEDEDDSHSSLSHRTEDSRPTTDDYFSDATTDSFDKSLDPDLKPRRLSQQKVVLKATIEDTDSVQKFKALAEKWEQRTDTKSPPPPPPPLIPAPRKEQKPYTGSIPTTSSFLSSVINSTSTYTPNGNGYASPISASLKLPPSLMPRNKHSAIQTETKSSIQANRMSCPIQSMIGNEKKISPLSSEKDFKNPYESVWVDDRSRKSSISGSRDVSDSGSDTGSNFSKRTTAESDTDTVSQYTSEIPLSNGNHVEHQSPMPSKELTKSRKLDFDVVVAPEDDVFKEKKQTLNNSFAYSCPPLPEKEKKRSSIGQADNYVAPNIRKLSDTEESISKVNGTSGHLSTMFQPDGKTQTDGSWRSESNLDLTTRRNSGREFQSSDFLVARALSKSQASLRDPLENVRSQASSYFSSRNAKSVSVSDIRKAFESQTIQNQNLASKPPPLPPRNSDINSNTIHKKNGVHRIVTISPDHKRLSSLDSTTSGDSGQVSPTRYGSVGSLNSTSRDMYGSVTSLASTTSLISPQELQQLIDDANQIVDDESKDLSHQEIKVIVLQREVPSGSIGITLAGGADYEIKEISVHKVISGSLADRDGRLKKGDKVISINGKPLKGTTHREALDILKAPRPEVVLVICREKEETNGQSNGMHPNHYNGESKMNNAQPTTRAKNHFRKRRDSSSLSTNGSLDEPSTANIVCVHLQKDATGLGFSIEGGKDSPHGDRPLLIKRIFKGGVADKEGKLQVGDEIISVNGQLVTSMTRTEAWNFLKKLPEEPILLRARKQVTCTS